MKRAIILVAVVLLVLLATPFLFKARDGRPLQGWVEADMLFIGPESSGRLTALSVREGETVMAGAPLFGLDDSTEKASLAAASALLARAEAQLALARAAQKRPQEIAVLRASERESEAKLALAIEDLRRAEALVAKGSGTRATLDTAIATHTAATAALDSIRKQIELAALPEREETIAAAEGSVSAARGDLASARAALSRRTVKAPADGTIEQLYYRAGEVVPAGRPVAALLPPENKRIRFFVAEALLSSVSLGEKVDISCDGCRPSTATVSFIAGSAEYTPPEIFSQEERTKLVYRVEAIPETPAILHVGQPVDVRLEAAAPDPKP